jgi:hypothetical protein
MPPRKEAQPRLNAAMLARLRQHEQTARIELAGAKRRLLLAADEYAQKKEHAQLCLADALAFKTKRK